jgi:5-methylthioadenosine/S-adenosylhomocysteine deaminase
MKRFDSKYIDDGHTWHADASLILDDEGLITALLSQTQADIEYPRENCQEYHALGNSLLMPGCINAHSHAFQVLLRPTTGQPLHFQDWVDRFLYPLVLTLNEEQLYASALLVFSDMLRHGITTVGEFFYVHNLEDGSSSHNRHARAVIQAARDVGLRIALIRTLYDLGHKEGQKRFREPLDQALAQTEALYNIYRQTPEVTIMPAPHSLHGASKELIIAGAELAQQLNTPWHIHLAEQQSDIPFAQERYGLSPVQCLAEWGVLNSRTVLVHAIWLNEMDKQLVKDAGASIAYNPITNMALGDGIADIPWWHNHGVPVALGTDANIQADLFAEARTTEYLQRSRKLAMGVIPEARSLAHMLNVHGGTVLGLPVGQLEPGYHGDFLVIDLSAEALLPASLGPYPEVPVLNQLIFSAPPAQVIRQVFVDGEEVVQNGQLSRLNPGQVAAELERALA